MSKNVADAVWELLHAAGVRRCYGIIGDALNPTIDVAMAALNSYTSGTRNTVASRPSPTRI